ncbi:monooxygenase [Zopfia rhizophila CBS 207.26]|uniref:Monooxygenase n=1 Tax=Zopfia rhizophila CBS 207.26 TaxID=1314779 RepID=A0A6A6D996_9PEZI|nr:monooxygenase [Zopfia rhizophila CBS 207.26]
MATLQSPDEHRFVIICGAGAAGIIQTCEFIRHKVFPIEEVELIDRNDGFGGVWWSNTYPGAACDIPSHLYSVSWALNPNWGRHYAPQREIQKYFEDIALKYGVDKVTTLNTEIKRATWDENQMLWVVETRHRHTGVRKVWTCNMFISAAGQFSVPKKAEIPGLDVFKGEEWHTVQWPKNADLRGKTLGIIGTGPSAAQLIPKIHKLVARMIIYQRSPSFCIPRRDEENSPLKKWVFAKIPFAMRLYRSYLYYMGEFLGRNAFVPGTWWQKQAIALAHGHVDNQVRDEKLRGKLKSKDHFGCKRPLVLDDYYPVFNEPNVELVTDSVVGLAEHGIISKNQETRQTDERQVDVLIWGTGFKSGSFGTAVPIVGRKGEFLHEKYSPDNFSLYGVAIDDFPNFFNFLGPNSLSFEQSVMETFEMQSKYILQVARYLYNKNKGSFRYAVMPRADVVKSWTLSLRPGQAKHPAQAPTCHSYYKGESGMVYSYPYRWAKYKQLIKKPNLEKDWVLLWGRPGSKSTSITKIGLP